MIALNGPLYEPVVRNPVDALPMDSVDEFMLRS